MEIRYHPRFERDLRRIRTPALSRRVERVIEELKAASSITEVRNVIRMAGRERHYCIRIGGYRLGLVLEGDTAALVRLGHRRDFYRSFP